MPLRFASTFHRLARGLAALLAASATLAGCTIMSNFDTETAAPARRSTGPCNDLPLGAPVRPEYLTGERPAPSGGTLSDGTYRLTAFALHAPAPAGGEAPLRAITVRVANANLELASLRAGEASSTASFRVATTGSTLTLERTCGDWTPSVRGYDATPQQLRIHVALPDGTGIWTLERVVSDAAGSAR
jgi:hypothetical protein